MLQRFMNFGYPSLDLSEAPIDVRAARLIVSVSGGRDSAAASLLLTENGLEHERVFMDTRWEREGMFYDYLRGPYVAALGPITEIRSDLGFVDLILKKGLFPSRVMRFCTEELKVFPAIEHISKITETETREVVNVVGIRRAESKKRRDAKVWEFSDSFHCWIWRPIATWHAADVAAIHEAHGLDINPLYYRGASRVGCWPCIHARKRELALVARETPEVIDLIDRLEKRLTAEGHVRDTERGLDPVPRTMFSYHGGDSKHFPLPIREAVEWANSARGEWQPAGAGDGCARYGFCSVDEEDEDQTQQQFVNVLDRSH